MHGCMGGKKVKVNVNGLVQTKILGKQVQLRIQGAMNWCRIF